MISCVDTIAEPNPEWDSDQPDPGTGRAPYRLYNIGNNAPVELMDFIGALEACLGLKAKKNMLPLQPGDVPDTYAEVDALVEDIGYRPGTPLEEGIEKFVSWYKEYYKIS